MISNNNMKFNDTKIILNLFLLAIILVILINFIIPIINFRDYNIQNRDPIDLDNFNMKFSNISERIHIDGNLDWINAETAGICTGNGTYSDPYVIKDLIIDGGSSGSCILIENSNVYFKIKNCTLYNSGTSSTNAGILLSNVTKAHIIDNNCSSNIFGIHLRNSNNNSICGNYANDNHHIGIGIYLYYSDSNNVSNNIANTNNEDGISLLSSHNNLISGNTANNNNYDGISLENSHYNFISRNNVSNKYFGILLSNSHSNTILGNFATENSQAGIELSSSSNNNVLNNSVKYNYIGIYIASCKSNSISGNIANNNTRIGFYVVNSDDNIISGNIANDNYYGIELKSSDYNVISGNTLLGNEVCIIEDDCIGNEFSNNSCNYSNTFPFELIVLILIIIGGISACIILLIFINKSIMRRSKKSKSLS